MLHYVEEHRYEPPDEFIRGALECPPTASAEYLRLIRDVGFWHPRAFSFGDNVRVLPSPATVSLAGLVGRVVGHSEPSVSKVQVHFHETGLSLWLSEQVLELVD